MADGTCLRTLEDNIRRTESQMAELQQFVAINKKFMDSTQKFMEESHSRQDENVKLIEVQGHKTDRQYAELTDLLRSLLTKGVAMTGDNLQPTASNHGILGPRPESRLQDPSDSVQHHDGNGSGSSFGSEGRASIIRAPKLDFPQFDGTNPRSSNGGSDSRIGNQHIPEMDFNEDSKDLEILVQVHTQKAQEDTMKGNNRLDSLLQETSIGKVHSNSLETLTFTTEHEGMGKPTDFLVVNPIDDAHIVFEKMLVVAIYVDPLNSADVLGTQSAHKVLEEMSRKEIGFSETFFELKEFGYPSIVVRIDGTMALFFSHESLLRPFDRGKKNTWVLDYVNVRITSWIIGLSSRLSFAFDSGGDLTLLVCTLCSFSVCN